MAHYLRVVCMVNADSLEADEVTLYGIKITFESNVVLIHARITFKNYS